MIECCVFLKRKLQPELHTPRIVGLGSDAPEIEALHVRVVRVEDRAVEGVERLPAKIHLEPLGETEGLREREVLRQVCFTARARVAARRVARTVTRLGYLPRRVARHEAAWADEITRRAAAPIGIIGRVGVPSVQARHISRVASAEDRERQVVAETYRRAARIEVNRRESPAAENRASDAPVQPFLALAERQLIDIAELEVVGQVVIADGFFQTTVVLIERHTARPVFIGVGDEFREDIGTEQRQPIAKALFELRDQGVIGRMAALVAVPDADIERAILWVKAERLSYRTSETRVRTLDTSRHGRRIVRAVRLHHLAAQYAGAIPRDVIPRQLLVVEQIGHEMRADGRVV